MKAPVVRFKRLHPDAILPTYATEGAAGLDLYAVDRIRIRPGEWRLVPIGLGIEIETGYEGQVRPRSGLARWYGVTVLNSPGTIDCDFRGEVQVTLINLGPDPYLALPGARIAQLVVAPVSRVQVELVEELSSTARGESGWKQGHESRPLWSGIGGWHEQHSVALRGRDPLDGRA